MFNHQQLREMPKRKLRRKVQQLDKSTIPFYYYSHLTKTELIKVLLDYYNIPKDKA